MRYADSTRCPSCRTVRQDLETRCHQCGFNYRNPRIPRIWQLLVELDDELIKARQFKPPRQNAPFSESPVGHSTQTASLQPAGPAAAEIPDRSVHRPVQSINVGTVLLALGALSLLVAATIFLTVSWDRMGPWGRSATLTSITVLVGAASWLALRRRLIATADSLIAVFLGLLTLDWFGLRALGIGWFDAIGTAGQTVIWSILIGGLAVGVIDVFRRTAQSTSFVAARTIEFVPWVGAAALFAVAADSWNFDGFWALLVAALLPAAWLALSLRRSWTVARISMQTLLVTIAAAAALAALFKLGDGATLRAAFVDGNVYPSLVWIALVIALGVVRSRFASVCSALAILGLAVVVVAIVSAEVSGEWAMVALAGFSFVAVVGAIGRSSWHVGIKFAASFILGYFALLVAVWTIEFFTSVLFGVRSGAQWDASLNVASDQALGFPWWLNAAALLALITGLTVARRWWKLPSLVSNVMHAAIASIASIALPLLFAGASQPAALISIALWLAAVAWWVISVVRESWLPYPAAGAQWAAVGLLVLAWAAASHHLGTASVASLVVAACFAFASLQSRFSAVVATAATLTVIFTLLAVDRLFGWVENTDQTALQLALTVVAVAFFATACWRREPQLWRLGTELGAALGAVLLIVQAVLNADQRWAAVSVSIIGAALLAAAADLPDRRWLTLPGALTSALAWFLVLIAAEVTLIEAYTGPLALVAFVAGVIWMIRDGQVSSAAALSVGTSLAVLPSLPQALADPTSLRASLLGLVSVVLLGLGWRFSWRVPYVAGATVLGMLLLVNLWPIAVAVRRWILFTILGLVLLLIGVTWESRVAQGRRVLQYVTNLR